MKNLLARTSEAFRENGNTCITETMPGVGIFVNNHLLGVSYCNMNTLLKENIYRIT